MPDLLPRRHALWQGALDAAGTNRSTARGFNTDKSNPTKETSGARLGPFFDFDGGRITYRTRTNRVVPPGPYGVDPDQKVGSLNWCVGASTGLHPRSDEQSLWFFPHYLDLWGHPYYYFAARTGMVDNYSHMYSPFAYNLRLQTSLNFHYHCFVADISVDFPGPDTNVPPGTIPPVDHYWPRFIPYMHLYDERRGTTYHHPNRFQIISAGADGRFGSGGMYDKKDPERSSFLNFKYISEEPQPSPGEARANYDNITNINFSRLVPRP